MTQFSRRFYPLGPPQVFYMASQRFTRLDAPSALLFPQWTCTITTWRLTLLEYFSRYPPINIRFEIVLYTGLREGTFFYWGGGGGGGGPGLRRGGSLVIFFTNWGGSNLLFAPGEGHSFFWQGKNYSMSLNRTAHYHLQLLSHSARRFWPTATKGHQCCS